MSMVIETRNLSRSYQTYKKPEGLLNSFKGIWNRDYIEKVALNPTSIQIEGKQIVGLVGANGAGKTTLLKILSGLIHPSSGEAKVLGFSPWERSFDYLRQISILLGQKNQLWWDIPPADSFELLARIYDIPLKVANARVQELSDLLACQSLLHTQLRRLSLGERMKMELIGALLHKPKVLFLDEPTIGLDVVAQITIREFLAKYVQEEGPTVILTSHYMDDIARLADRLLLISHGSIVYDGTVSGFMSKAEPTQKLTVVFQNPMPVSRSLSDKISIAEGSRELQVELPAQEMGRMIAQITALSPVQELKLEEANFEEVIFKFLQTESRIRTPGRHLST